MKIKLIYLLLFTAFTLVFGLMVDAMIADDQQLMQRIHLTQDTAHYYSNRLRLPPQKIEELKLTITAELQFLAYINYGVIIFALVVLLLLIGVIAKTTWQTVRFGGLHLLIANLVLLQLHWLMDFVPSYFYAGTNATMDIGISTSIILLLLQPILFFVAFLWNKLELKKQLHQQRWISIVAITLAILSGLIALIIGISVLFTPDLSGNIT